MWFCFSTFKYIGSLWQENEEIKLWTKLVATTVAGKKPVSCSSKLTVAIVVWRQPIYADESHTHTHTHYRLLFRLTVGHCLLSLWKRLKLTMPLLEPLLVFAKKTLNCRTRLPVASWKQKMPKRWHTTWAYKQIKSTQRQHLRIASIGETSLSSA